MFTTFQEGSDDPSNWNHQPNYKPGRFHAHDLTTTGLFSSTSPTISSPPGLSSSYGRGTSGDRVTENFQHYGSKSSHTPHHFVRPGSSSLALPGGSPLNPAAAASSSSSSSRTTLNSSSLYPSKSKRERLNQVKGEAKKFFRLSKRDRREQQNVADKGKGKMNGRGQGRDRGGGGMGRGSERERLLSDGNAFNTPRAGKDGAISQGRRLFVDQYNHSNEVHHSASSFRRAGGKGKRGISKEHDHSLHGRNDGEEEEDDDSSEISWLLLRPGKKRVKRWMASWWKRWALLVLLPCCIVWVWCSIPFPVSDPYKTEPPWHIPWPPSSIDAPGSFETLLRRLPWNQDSRRKRETSLSSVNLPVSQKVFTTPVNSLNPAYISPQNTSGALKTSEESVAGEHGKDPTNGDGELPVDANFYFFLIIYYGAYLAVALVFVTKLFDLYRLNWWPSSLGGAFWYTLFWLTSLSIGFLLHKFDLDGFGRRSHHSRSRPGGGRGGDGADPSDPDSWDWERKTTWVLLAFATMSMPALACFGKLRADRRNSWRRSLTPAQKTFLERQLTQRMPRSYRRFLWFLTAIAISLLTLIMGQGFATIYLSTLPHSNFEGLVYVWTLILSISLLNNVSNWILQRKVRSQSLVFIFRLLFQLTYHVFYRNLFARLRSPDQAVYITLLSSSFVILWYPVSMSKTFHRLLKWLVGTSMDWPEYSHSVATMFYLRNLSENVTMVAFLGWVTILHWGPNQLIYPFFSFADPSDPYTYRLTISASLVIWIAELFSSWMARGVCWLAYGIDVTNVGLDQLREHPDLVVACLWASTHVLMDILLFLVKLNFR